MSDPNYGEPVEENIPADEATSIDDAVASAHEGLADAEAASREAAADAAATDAADAAADAASDAADAATDAADAAADAGTVATTVSGAADAPTESYARDAELTLPYETYATDAEDAAAAGAVAVTAPEPVAPVAAPAPQPIFVQAPEAPRPRGNRAAAGLIGLLAAISFGVLYLGGALALRASTGEVTGSNVGTEATAALLSWWFWVPVVVFFLGFWLLGAIINRGRWGIWVIFGLLVGAVAYGGHILGQLFQAPFWMLTAREGADLVEAQLLAPLAIVAFVLGRELTIWFGAWVAARGRRITELNNEAQREYERTLEAGPRIHQG
ncbi:ABC transporter [Microbacterium sp.]|uniref:ABC transporter n=1 Tax=Microbacterium sp. TaxID=51671 RepID=UPI0039E60790